MMRGLYGLVFGLLLAVLLCVACAQAGEINVDKLVSKEAIKPKGQWYQAMVPDTLDLADRARFAINGLTVTSTRISFIPWYSCLLG